MAKLKKERSQKSKTNKPVKAAKPARKTIQAKPAKKAPVKIIRPKAAIPLTAPVKAAAAKVKTPPVLAAVKPRLASAKKAIPKEPLVSAGSPAVVLPAPKEKLSVEVMAREKAEVKVRPAQAIAPLPKIPPKQQPPEVKKEPILEKPAPVSKPAVELRELELKLPITVKDLSVRIQQKPSALIKGLMAKGAMVGINQVLEEALVANICEQYGFRIKKAPGQEELALQMHNVAAAPHMLKHRPPVVTFMGHVDHGKTSLLDAIRKTKLAESEHGGITQHIGAYRVVLSNGEITFLDTPGHEAFTAMRARGAQATDIVVLVVAADDGVMPQTIEAIDHARAAGVTIIVAVNKVDKPQANPDMVKKQLSELGLRPEDWQGKTVTVNVSAKTGQGIDNLLEMILLEAQMLELKADPTRPARGVVLEAELTKGKGPIATLLVQNGTLRVNDNILAGKHYGKIKAMLDEHGQAVKEAGPSFPVEVLGLSGVPGAGEQFFMVKDEKSARDLAVGRQELERQQQARPVKRISLEDLHLQIKEGKIKELKLIIKADVQGSLGAIRDTLNKLNVSEIKIGIIHEAVGSINTSDIILAAASNALVLGFNVKADEQAKDLIAKEGVDVKSYNIIYELANDIKAAVEGMLEPKLKKVFSGRAEVKQVFKLSRSGIVAGCFVAKGSIRRNASLTVVRNGEAVFEGSLSSLKRFKDDVRDVGEGLECGITISGFEDIKEGDLIETYEIEKIARKL